MYTIVENQHRADGVINQVVTNRASFASALSYYHDRYSKMAMTELYVKVDLILLDENLVKKAQDVVPTCYVAPVEPVEDAEPAQGD